MDRETLRRLDAEAMIEVILQLQAQVAALHAELARLRQPPKTSENSSVPPSAGFKTNRAERRARQRRPGHDGISRRRQGPAVIVRCRPERCDGCGVALPKKSSMVFWRNVWATCGISRPLPISRRDLSASSMAGIYTMLLKLSVETPND